MDEESKIDLEYDIYISYERDPIVTGNETLHEFVTQKMYSQLMRRGFRVLIRDELEIGMKLYDVISRALRKCDKVIILLTKDYIKIFGMHLSSTWRSLKVAI